MQVEATQTTTPYVNETKKTESTSSSTFDMTKPFDINTFSFEDYKNISAQELSDWIMNGDRPEDGWEAITFNNLASYTEDDNFNKVIFDKAKDYFDQNDGSMKEIFDLFLIPLADMNSSIEIKDVNLDPKNSAPYQESYVNKFDEYATKSSLYNINNVLNDMNTIPEFYEKNKEKLLWGDTNQIFSFLDDIQNKYEQRTNENNAVLDNYTKNNKPNVLSI